MREVVEWYQDNYDGEIKVEEVVKELKKKLEREEELEKRTETLIKFYNNGGFKSISNISSEELEVALALATVLEEEEESK